MREHSSTRRLRSPVPARVRGPAPGAEEKTFAKPVSNMKGNFPNCSVHRQSSSPREPWAAGMAHRRRGCFQLLFQHTARNAKPLVPEELVSTEPAPAQDTGRAAHSPHGGKPGPESTCPVAHGE